MSDRVYLVADCQFNRANAPELIGHVFADAPSYVGVIPVDEIAGNVPLWRNAAHFRCASAEAGQPDSLYATQSI